MLDVAEPNFFEKSSRLVPPYVIGCALFSLFTACFRGGATIFQPSQVVPSPSQNRACAIYAHGSSHEHSQS